MVKHIGNDHKKIKKFKCNFCGKIFGIKHNLETHVENVHEGLRKYTCDTCGKNLMILVF